MTHYRRRIVTYKGETGTTDQIAAKLGITKVKLGNLFYREGIKVSSFPQEEVILNEKSALQERCCLQCGKDFMPANHRFKFCSNKCRNRHTHLRHKQAPKPLIKKTCCNCGRSFETRLEKQKACRSECKPLKKPRPTKVPVGAEPGTRYHFLTVISFAGRNKNSDALVSVRCDCGVEKVVDFYRLTHPGGPKSCGCYGLELNRIAAEEAASPERKAYRRLKRSWMHIKNRCYQLSNKSFPDYGGRGIRMCDRWRFGENGMSGFACFHADMGDRPAGHTIERRDNDGDYTPDNCLWVIRDVQPWNTRVSVWLLLNGVKMAQPVVAAKLGMVCKNLDNVVRRCRRNGVSEFKVKNSVINII